MRIFYQESTKKLIITPFLTGSSILMDKVIQREIELTWFDHGNEVQRKCIEEILKDTEINKTFLYRDPVERVISFYHKFIFDSKITEKNKNTEGLKLFTPKNRKENFWDEVWEALPLIETHYKKNDHLIPQYTYFSFFKENPEEYEIYSTDNYVKWFFLEFAITLTEADHEFLKHTGQNVFRMYRIIERLQKLYPDDIQKIQPLIKPI
jgi:hypothetical protein